MSNHTKEPWVIDGNFIRPGLGKVMIVEGLEISCHDNKANLDRIVACVNACQNINPEAVRGMLATLKALTATICRSKPPGLVISEDDIAQLQGIIKLAESEK